MFTQRPVLEDVAAMLPSSLELVLAAMVINIVVAVPLGTYAAWRSGRAADAAARLITLLGAAVPVFWLGLMLQLVFAAELRVLPLTGQLSFGRQVPSHHRHDLGGRAAQRRHGGLRRRHGPPAAARP
ncbi:hypothetical protein ACFSTC_21365 [Nonomuraea ferruginea]